MRLALPGRKDEQPWLRFLEEIPTEDAFWNAYRDNLMPVVRDIWFHSFLAGAHIAHLAPKQSGAKALGEKQIDIDRIMHAAQKYIDQHSDAWWERLRVSQERILREAIQTAREQGLTPSQVAYLIAPQFGSDRAMGIAVTEMTSLLGAGAQAQYAAEGYVSWSWNTSEDAIVCDDCQDMADGGPYDIEMEFDAAHPSCVIAGTLISEADVLAVTSRPYHGDVIVLRTSRGDVLTITPNHPVLSSSGWVSADMLREGDDVIGRHRGERVPPVGPNDEQMPARVEEIAGALLRSAGMMSRSVPGASEQFHGDGSYSNVEIVGANSGLRPTGLATVQQPVDKQLLTVRRLPRRLERSGLSGQLVVAGRAPDGHRMSSTNLGSALVCRHGRPLQRLGIRRRSWWNAGLLQSSPDHEAVDAKRLGQRVLGLAGKVATDHELVVELLAVPGWRQDAIVEIRRRPFSGHVFNLQAERGWYAANSVIVANCRCWPVPEELGPAEEDMPDAPEPAE